jgi:hypothetical protein
VAPPERGGSPLVWLLQAIVVAAALVTRRRPRRGPPGVDASDLAVGYARGDMRVGVVLAVLGGLVLVLGGVLVLVTSLQVAATGAPPSISRPADLIQGLQGTPAPTPPPPRLEAQPGSELAAYREAKTEELSTYRWVDRQAGVVTVPIDRAMELVAQRGLPARQAPAAAAAEDANRSPSRASSGRVDEAWP